MYIVERWNDMTIADWEDWTEPRQRGTRSAATDREILGHRFTRREASRIIVVPKDL